MILLLLAYYAPLHLLLSFYFGLTLSLSHAKTFVALMLQLRFEREQSFYFLKPAPVIL